MVKTLPSGDVRAQSRHELRLLLPAQNLAQDDVEIRYEPLGIWRHSRPPVGLEPPSTGKLVREAFPDFPGNRRKSRYEQLAAPVYDDFDWRNTASEMACCQAGFCKRARRGGAFTPALLEHHSSRRHNASRRLLDEKGS